MSEQANRNIGALWSKKSKAGMNFLSGNVEINGEKIEIVVFKNTDKKNENGPDFRILLSTPYEGTKAPTTQAKKPAQKQKVDDDIDF